MKYLTNDDYEIAAKNGISYNVAYARFYEYGWSKEDTITKPIIKPNMWPTHKELAYSNGIGQNTFHARVRKGMTPEEAATTPLKQRGGKYLGGRITPEMYARAKDNGIKRNTLIHRVYHYGWDAEKATTEPVKNGRKAK
jgi:hypothetical protein